MIDLSRPVDLSSPDFINDKYAAYERIREEKPVQEVKISVMKLYAVSRYEDCEMVLKDPRIKRNRSNATGGSQFPFPVPRSVKPLVQSMIQEDDPEHRRLRELVRKGFRPQEIKRIESRIDSYSQELLDDIGNVKEFELQSQYALQLPSRMIADMLGVPMAAMPKFQAMLSTVVSGFSGLRMLRTLFVDLPGAVGFVRDLVRDKQNNPGEDILTGLIQAEEGSDKLTEDELIAMVFLLTVGGFETTVHLITNGVLTLLQHPGELEKLKNDPTLIDSAVEEIMRHRGPVHMTKPNYTAEEVTLHGVTIPKGKPIVPLFGAANHDPRIFDNPGEFDITRSPNRHLGFGHGIHFCLGAHLARAEACLAIKNLFARFPDLGLAVDESALELAAMPGWHRYNGLPVTVEGLRTAA
jgi:cytochrome P450